MNKILRVGAFGFRSIPMRAGSAGADKFVLELLPRLVIHGHKVVAYNRVYPSQPAFTNEYKGVKIVNIKTLNISGFDTVIHSFLATIHILVFNTADIVHMQNGGNSVWAFWLRLFGKKVVVSQDGFDWKRDKWPWYGKLYLKLSTYVTAHLPNKVVFDNIFVKKFIENKYQRKYDHIPFGAEVGEYEESNVLSEYSLEKNNYFLFVGRFIPDKGIHYLIEAFNASMVNKKLVIVGGPPNPSAYADDIRSHASDNILFPGYLYDNDANTLIKNAFCYIQPSDVEGLSPVLLQAMGLGCPVICSDIQENLYVVGDTALSFKKSNANDLARVLNYADNNPLLLSDLSAQSQKRALESFSWEKVVSDHIYLFENM
jgi:glycosyltransferase involved in cell wall biosynthesis